MKTMVMIQNDEERNKLLEIWNGMLAAKEAGERYPTEGNHIESALCCHHKYSAELFENRNGEKGNNYAIVYDLREDGWHIYNFNTMEEEVVGEGDLAGLCNSKAGNFPFFN